ncbi:hypothetical protein QI633_25075 [Nocardioides sp. QY071]|nr:hypothetical protein [Nocardioides sp. QY071]WGY01794.1 hypothetical protein QI633_25075 [Nocardioides sp. QY071]
MPTSERPLRLAEFDELFADALVDVTREATTAILRLSGTTGPVGAGA